MLKKIGIGLGALVVLIVAALLVVPLFVDADSFKPRVAAAIKDLTGRELTIAGPVRLRLLPSPTLEAEDIRLSNMPGGKAASMVEAKSLRMALGLFPLLSRRLEITELKLVDPRIALEVAADGRTNFDFSAAPATPSQPGTTTAPPPRSAGDGYRITAERIVVENGTVSLIDARTGRDLRLDKIALTASLQGIPSPATINGTLIANGVPMTVEIKLAAPNGAQQPIEATLKVDDGDFHLAGSIEDLSKAPRYIGSAKLVAGDFAGFVTRLARATGTPPPDLPPALARKVAYEGGLEAGAAGIVARDFRLTLGEDSGSGSLSVVLSPLKIDGKLVFTRLDLDKWLATAGPSTVAPVPAPAAPPARPTPAAPATSVKLDLRAAQIIYNGRDVKDVVVDVELAQGNLALRKMTAVLPGNARIDATTNTTTVQGKRAYDGTISLEGGQLRETLSWLKVDVASVPTPKLGAFALKGKLSGSGADTVTVSDATVQLDGMNMKGAITVVLRAIPSIALDLQADTVDLDAYMPRRAEPAKAPAKGTPPSPPPPARDLSSIDARVKAKIARLTYGGETIDGLDADVTLRGGRLILGDSRAAGIAGGTLTLKGNVTSLGPTPAFDLNVGAQGVNVERLAKLAGVAPPSKTPIGVVSVQGGVAGTPSDLTFRDVQATALGASLRLTGKLSLRSDGPRYDYSAFSLRSDDLSRVMAALGEGQVALGDISAAGALQGDPKTISYRGNFALKGIQAQGSVRIDLAAAVPRVTADLRVGDLDLDKLTGGAAATGAPGAPAAAGSRHSRAPIDLSALKSIDGQFTVAAATLQKGAWRLDNAQLEVALRGGVLTISKLTGGFYGGTLDLSGKIDGARNPGHLDARVNVADVNLGRLGPALVNSQRVGGVLTANFTFNASLASVHDLVGTLNGDGRVGGAIRFNVTDAERLAGQAAGAVGGVLQGAGDALKGLGGNTPILGGLARGAGSGVEGLGLAMRIALERFVGRNAPLNGEITIRDGQLTTNNTRVDGDRAWAMITANVNLPAWTQETAINVFAQEDPTRPVVTVRQLGSVDSPVRTINAGGAAVYQQGAPPPAAPPRDNSPIPAPLRGILKGLGGR